MNWTPEEDAFITHLATTHSASEIAKKVTERFGTNRTLNAVENRRKRLRRDHADEPIGLVLLSDVAPIPSGKRARRVDAYVKRRAIEDNAIVKRRMHGRIRNLVSNAWADKIVEEVITYRNEWPSTEQVAAMMGLPVGDRALNIFEATTMYPKITNMRRVQIDGGWHWHPDDVRDAVEEVKRTKERHKWLRRNWWNTKTAAEFMGLDVEALRGLASMRFSYWGAPTNLLVREVGAGGTVYYEPESVRVFTAKMDERRTKAKKKVGVDETPTKPDAGIP